MDKRYAPADLEANIYKKWMDNHCFTPKSSKANYSIVLPPL